MSHKKTDRNENYRLTEDTLPLTGTVKGTAQHVLTQFYHKSGTTTGVKINHLSLVPNHFSAYAIFAIHICPNYYIVY